MAVAATVAPSAFQRLKQALEQENPRPLLLSGLERDAKSLFGTPDAPYGYLILGMLDAINNRKDDFDKHLDVISASDIPAMANFFRLNGLNRMGYFEEATVYLKQMFAASEKTDDPLFLKPLAHLGMLYGFIERPGRIIERLNKMNSLETNQQDELEQLHLLLKNTEIDEVVLVSAILAAKERLKEIGFQIPTYSFGYSIESDIFIELKMLCFGSDIDRMAEADEMLSRLLIDMEESADANLINFSISCRPYNRSYGIGS